MTEAAIRHRGADEIVAGTPWPDLIEAIAAAFREGGVAPLRSAYSVPDGASDRTLLTMPAWTASGAFGVKLATVSSANSARGLATIGGIYVLFDARTGLPVATFDAAPLTTRRTAATSALAADRLARPDAKRLLIVGTGPLAAALAEAHASVRRFERVSIWGRDPARTAALADDLRSRLTGSDVVVAPSLQAATREADIVSAATSSEAPLVFGAWLRPGTHLDLVGAHRPGMREADAEAVSQAHLVYVDDVEAARAEAGDLIAAAQEGAFDFAQVAGTLSDLADKSAMRRGDADRTIFKSVGHGLEDLAAARLCAAGHMGD